MLYDYRLFVLFFIFLILGRWICFEIPIEFNWSVFCFSLAKITIPNLIATRWFLLKRIVVEAAAKYGFWWIQTLIPQWQICLISPQFLLRHSRSYTDRTVIAAVTRTPQHDPNSSRYLISGNHWHDSEFPRCRVSFWPFSAAGRSVDVIVARFSWFRDVNRGLHTEPE